MRQSFHLIIVILAVIVLASSGVAHAGEKRVFVGGVWYNQQRDGSLTVCQECNAGRPVAIPTEAIHPPDCPTSYPCQMIAVQYSSPAKAAPCVACESCTGPGCVACPCQSAQTVKSDGRFQLGIGGGLSGSCSAGVNGLFSRRPIRSFFGRLFGGCGG
jgi:hypothetical protein